jgi:hypothetical protein
MTIIGYRRATIILSILSTCLITLSASLIVHFAPLEMRLMMARSQVQLFDDMREQALQAAPGRAADLLDYVAGYYPSGSKQIAGSKLDLIVEQARSSTIREIISHLRKTTGEDLGNTARPWIQKFSSGK